MTATRITPENVARQSRDNRTTIARRLAREEEGEVNPSLSLGYVVVNDRARALQNREAGA